jgi:threonine/homoserine/homoserine lactone efflux protein
MSTYPRRKRRNTKTLDSMKVGAILLLMVLGILLIVWIGLQLLRPKEEQPDLRPQPGRSMWEGPPANG